MFKRWIFFLLVALIRLAVASDFLPLWQAFQVQVAAGSESAVWVKFNIAPEYHVYQNKIKIISLPDSQVELGSPLLPDPILLHSPDFGSFKVYEQQTNIQVPILHYGNGRLHVQINYQGCKGLNMCFPEQQLIQEINLTSTTQDKPKLLAVPSSVGSNPYAEQFSQASWLVILGFFGLGLLIAFTPCVFPLLPVLLAVISGGGINLRRSFSLAFSYIVGGAVAYAAAGVLAASLGVNLSRYLQAAWLSYVLAALFGVFALSLFGVFTLQLPLVVQNKLNSLISSQRRGSLLGSFMIGGLANLILSPCVTAPLAGALVYIATTGNRVLGASALFALGLGSGIPLLIIALFGKRLLPKSGSWMNLIKHSLGLLMLLMAIYLLSKQLELSLIVGLVGLWSCGVAVVVVWQLPLSKRLKPWLVLVCALLSLVGSYTYQRGISDDFPPSAIVRTPAELDTHLIAARQAKQAVVLDYYASWCLACKEMDQQTFKNAQIRALLDNFKLIRIDVSANDSDSVALEQRYHVIAPPSLVFIDSSGRELAKHAVNGFIASKDLALNLQDILAIKSTPLGACHQAEC